MITFKLGHLLLMLFFYFYKTFEDVCFFFKSASAAEILIPQHWLKGNTSAPIQVIENVFNSYVFVLFVCFRSVNKSLMGYNPVFVVGQIRGLKGVPKMWSVDLNTEYREDKFCSLLSEIGKRSWETVPHWSFKPSSYMFAFNAVQEFSIIIYCSVFCAGWSRAPHHVGPCN